MAQRQTLLNISYITDDSTGIYRMGEIDFGVCGILEEYIKQYGYDGVKDILVTLGHLAWEVKNIYYKNCKQQGGAEWHFGKKR